MCVLTWRVRALITWHEWEFCTLCLSKGQEEQVIAEVLYRETAIQTQEVSSVSATGSPHKQQLIQSVKSAAEWADKMEASEREKFMQRAEDAQQRLLLE